ncbi:MAG: DUF2182 domain-containing protein [Gammaproteobacteria bacterium]|nr:DUF2182 domain-containing protein [Gammaproteobacteria bacterium]
MTGTEALEQLLKRDRVIVLVSLVVITGLAWLYLVDMAADMSNMPMTMDNAVSMAQVKSWSMLDFVLLLLMWSVMMIGMMVPSAAPMILLFAMVSRKQRERGHTFAPTTMFIAGYLVAWTGFSFIATILQWMFDQAALLSPMMVSTSPVLGGLLLVSAGVYQLTPLKHACLKRCRSPLEFITRRWRRGNAGALMMGMEHGAYCVGCCWFLMGLLFFGGVMNLVWVAAIAVLVLLEKVAPFGQVVGKVSGVLLIISGLVVSYHGQTMIRY